MLKKANPKRIDNSVDQFLTEEKFRELEKFIGCSINEKSHFTQALVHRSFLEQNDSYQPSNERLEFLGDSVLSLVIAEYLYSKYPDEEEGFLTKVRAKIVNRKALADAAERMRLEDFILISKNISKDVVFGSKSILSDAFEALIGAVYLDNGIEASRKFIIRVLLEPILKDGEHLIDENYKSQLLEYAQGNKLDVPLYSITQEEGPQHDRIFTVEVRIGARKFGTGKGKSKKSAEQEAAKTAIEKIKSDNSSHN
ncbi:MAG TPA: ribonuclease III [Ignavibacteriaceae bacterium]